MDVKNYIKAARLRTLPLSVSGIIVGSFLAAKTNQFDWTIFVLAIFTTIGFQVLSNFANDYGDGIKGTDKNREGEERMVASGKISSSQMKQAMIVTTIITLLIAVLLIYQSFGAENLLFSLVFFGLGIVSIAAAIKYTVGKSAYGYSGFGDLFVFLFFGIISVLGSNFLFTKQLDLLILLPAFSVGMLSTAVLNLNNMRDRINDAKFGKNTIVVKIGPEFAKYYHYYLLVGSLLFSLLYNVIYFEKPTQFLFLLAYIPIAKHMIFVSNNTNEAELDSQLKVVALSTFIFGILFGVGFMI